MQKWLESLGEMVVTRCVEQFVIWLNHQRNIRRISNLSTSSKYGFQTNSTDTRKRTNHLNRLAQHENCLLCNDDQHEVYLCSKFINLSLDEKWDIVKQNRLCFQCLKPNHRRENCNAPLCQYCGRAHHCMLHNDYNKRNDVTLNQACTSSTAWGKEKPPRCLLPIINATLINNGEKVSKS